MADPKVPVIIPEFPAQRGPLLVEDIRHFIWDRTIADNPIEMDLEFSDTEIGWAIKFAVKHYNSTPPYIRNITSDQMIFSTMWLYAVCYQLFLAKLMKLGRTDFDYSAGGMTVDLNARRIKFYSQWSQTFKEEAMRLMKEQKVIANIDCAYRAF